MMIDVVAIMHSAVAARNETIVAVSMLSIRHLHCFNTVSCDAWYTLSLKESRRIGVLSAKALSMAKRQFGGAKPEVVIMPLTTCGISCQKLYVLPFTPRGLSLLHNMRHRRDDHARSSRLTY